MIDQTSRRRAGYSEGGSATLADGQTWTFPRVSLRLAPRRAADGSWSVGVARTVAGAELPRYEDWIAAITSPPGAIPGDVYWTARMDAAATLLGLNYDLADGELAALLACDVGDPAAAARWDAIDAAVLGTSAPKPSPATSDSP